MSEYKYNPPSDTHVMKGYITRDGHTMFTEDVVKDIRNLQAQLAECNKEISAIKYEGIIELLEYATVETMLVKNEGEKHITYSFISTNEISDYLKILEIQKT